MNAVEAQDVGSERAQTRKDARIASDAAGVLGEATVTDVVGAILDVPVVTDGLGTLSRWQHDVADKQGGLADIAPKASGGGADEYVAIDADNRTDVAIPLGVGQAVARREYFDRTGFVAAPTLLVGGLCAIERCCDVAQRGDGVMKGWLVGFDLSDQMNAGGGGLLECFF